MPRDTNQYPRRNKPAEAPTEPAFVFSGRQINPDDYDATKLAWIASYVHVRYYGTYPRPKLDPFDKGYAGSRRALIASPTPEGQKRAIALAGGMTLADRALFEAENPHIVEWYEQWVAAAWSVNGQILR